MRRALERIKNEVDNFGTNLEDKDIELRDILREMLAFLDLVIPMEQDPE
jgi:hypothetical protein